MGSTNVAEISVSVVTWRRRNLSSSGILGWVGVVSMCVGAMGCNRNSQGQESNVALSPEQIEQIVKKTLEEKKLIKSEKQLADEKAASEAMPAYMRSREFLVGLDRLMNDYVPKLPEQTDDTDLLRCSTSLDLANNASLKKAATVLKERKKSNENDRTKVAAEFEKNKWVQYRLDYSWPERIYKTPVVMDCWADNDWYWSPVNAQRCERVGVWKVRTPESAPVGFYSRLPIDSPEGKKPPELMRRVEAAGVVVPDRFSCQVADVTNSGSEKDVLCKGDIPRGVSLRVSNDLPAIHVGDVVSVPLKDVKRDPDGVLFKRKSMSKEASWVIDADGPSVKIDSVATCPTLDEIESASTKK